MALRTVRVPPDTEPIFARAEEVVAKYFGERRHDPSQGTIEVAGQRYVLVRAAALSVEFFALLEGFFGEGNEARADEFARNILFDLSHAIGKSDAENFHAKMGLTDPIERLSAGPVHFAHSGWAFVDISPDSRPTPDEDYYLLYDHPFSFEADAWIRSGRRSGFPVCIMNTGYSSGWCERSFGVPLVASEIMCRAKGDECCRFIMAPPNAIEEHIRRYVEGRPEFASRTSEYTIPDFFARKRIEEELRRAKEDAEAATRAKSVFLAKMSHEIRTPLNAILGMTELVLDTSLTDSQREYLTTVLQSGEDLLSLVNDILDISKIEAQKLDLEEAVFDLPALVSDTVKSLAVRAHTKGLELLCDVNPDVPRVVVADDMRLRQIIVNLVGNAIKFTESGEVRLTLFRASQAGQKVVLCFAVRDTGIGIPVEKKDAIFRLFEQADSGTTRKFGGSGLGLSIASDLAKLMGGTLRVESEPNRGSTFFCTIPCKVADGHAVDALADSMALAGRRGTGSTAVSPLRVLVAEDSQVNQKLVVAFLEKHGHQVTLVNNGKEATAAITAKQFDLVLMDVEMPEMDGFEATRIIRDRERETGLHVPIVALTAHAMRGDQERCLEAGMDSYLSKPVRSDQLFDTIASVLGESQHPT